jgi:hypothetical protein
MLRARAARITPLFAGVFGIMKLQTIGKKKVCPPKAFEMRAWHLVADLR